MGQWFDYEWVDEVCSKKAFWVLKQSRTALYKHHPFTPGQIPQIKESLHDCCPFPLFTLAFGWHRKRSQRWQDLNSYSMHIIPHSTPNFPQSRAEIVWLDVTIKLPWGAKESSQKFFPTETPFERYYLHSYTHIQCFSPSAKTSKLIYRHGIHVATGVVSYLWNSASYFTDIHKGLDYNTNPLDKYILSERNVQIKVEGTLKYSLTWVTVSCCNLWL